MTTYTSHYPPAHNSTYVKAISTYPGSYEYQATDPSKSLTGVNSSNGWDSNGATGSLKFNIDHGEAFVASRIYLENSHISGGYSGRGCKDILVYGTNSATAFANTDYSDTTDLTLLATIQAAAHVASDVADPQYFLITGNSTAYRYTVLRISTGWGDSYIGLRRIEIQSEDEPVTTDVTLSLNQPVSMALIVSLLLDQPVALRKLLSISIDQSCSMELVMSLIQRCRAMSTVSLTLYQWVRSRQQVYMRFAQRVGVCPSVCLSLDQWLQMPGRVTLSLDQAVVIAGQRLTLSLDQMVTMNTDGRVTLRLSQSCALSTDDAIQQLISVSVTVGGRAVDPDYISIKADDSDGFMSANIRFPDYQQYLLCNVGDEVIITELLDDLPAEVTVLQVQSLANPEEIGSADHILTAVSPTIALDEVPLNDDLGPGVADALMTADVAGYGFTMDWQGVDGWPFLVVELRAEDETLYQVLVRLAAASGAFLQSLPDGETIRLRPEYAVNVGDWPTATTDLEINDQDHIFTIDEDPDERDGYNAFMVSGQSCAVGEYRLDDTELTATKKEFRGYQVPFNASQQITLGHKGGDWVSIDYLGIHEEQVTDENVVITAGIGQLQLPCYQLVSWRYKEDGLGDISAEEDGSITSLEIGDALVDVTYITRYRKWIMTDPKGEHVLAYIE
jgi:hypothetical protein